MDSQESHLLATPPDRTPPTSPSAHRTAAAEKDRIGARVSLTICVRSIVIDSECNMVEEGMVECCRYRQMDVGNLIL